MKDYKVDKAKFSVSFCQEVYQVVCDIPVGKVSTYGEIAALLGMPQCSRMVVFIIILFYFLPFYFFSSFTMR